MGLSNYVPNSRIAQPGVCTSTTRPATPFEGQVIYETDTNRVLVWDASAWVMIADTDQPPALQLVKTQIFSGATSVDVTNAFSSDFENYRLVFTNLQVAQAGSNTIFMKMGVGGSRSDASYYLGGSFTTPAAVQGALNLNNATTGWYVINCNNSNDSHAEMLVARPNVAEITGMSMQGMEGIAASWNTSGVHNVATAYTGFTLSGSANISGTVRVYGYRD